MTTHAPAATGTTLERYEVVIGIEIHCQLTTATKMFCGCSTDVRRRRPNTHTCPVCLGLPGALPVINRRAVEHVLATGLAIGATVPEVTRWDRKNYFYPDLPKGYQISQYDLPLASGGTLDVRDVGRARSRSASRRAHLEEDTARLIHATGADGRAGQPGRLQPLRRAADGDRDRARHPRRPRRRAATPRSCGCCC